MRKHRKIGILITIFIFSFNLLPISAIKASEDVNIVSNTSISVQEAKNWAKSRGATDIFIGLADLYWKYAPQHGGVNPAIAYVQAAKETGFGKFGGVINETFHNPCGLKTTVTGADNDPNAHKVFNNWDEGVQAHLDHLALYAGASGYPRKTTYDPRHFASILGKAKTVVALGGGWAPSITYGQELLALYNSLELISSNSKSYGNIEACPVSSKSITVNGWALNPKGIKEIQIYLDGEFKGNAQYGLSRPDVQKCYVGYSNADKSGYTGTIDISKLSSGNKTLEIRQIGNDGTTTILKKTISVFRKQAGINIDVATINSTASGDKLYVEGWALNDYGVKEINIYVDGKLKGKGNYGELRPDVDAGYPGYPDGSKCGYSATVDISDISGGSRLVVAELVGNDGSVVKKQISIIINKPAPASNLEDCKVLSNNKLYIRGWAIHPQGIKEVQIYVDGQFKGNAQYGISRPDVQAAFKGYPNADKSGFTTTIDVSTIAVGSKNVEIKRIGNDGSQESTITSVNIARKPSGINIESPIVNSNVYGNKLSIKGWALNDSGVKQLNIYVDGKLKGKANYGELRPDVNAVYPGYPEGSKSGYSATVDITDIAGGSRLVVLELVGNDGSVVKNQTSINVGKPVPASNLEDCKLLSNNQLYIRGWAINPQGIKEVQIYINGQFKGNAQYGISRPDVQAAYKGYLNADKSGFTTTIDVSTIAAGSKTIEIRRIGNDGSQESTITSVNISRKPSGINIESPVINSNVIGDKLNIKGWALNDSGVKEINIYVDGKFKGKANYGELRPDVNAVYPGYPEGSKSGYSATVDITDIASGSRLVVLELIGNDGSVVKNQISIIASKTATAAAMFEDGKMSGNNKLYIRGWAINPKGIKEVQVYVDGKFKGNAQYGISRPDVQAAFNGYPNADKSGFTTTVDVSNIGVGYKTAQIKCIGNDGVVSILSGQVNITRKIAGINIESPSVSYLEMENNLQIRGWAINDAGVSSVKVYIDNVLKKTASVGIARPDVKAAYPNYVDSANSGFNTTVDISQIAKGRHILKVEVMGIDGSLNSMERTFYSKEKLNLIVVDPGHNYGKDYGAEYTSNGVKYSETEMNMSVALRLQSALQAQGYSVILTRSALERSTLDLTTSLQTRARIANDLNADLFISVHHNAGPEKATGTEVYYTQRSTPDDASVVQNADKMPKSKDLAVATANGISANTGFVNRGGRGDLDYLRDSNGVPYSLSVLRNTKMPAILVECGFISNPTEASLLVKPEYQQAIANGITSSVKARF
jgi:N-acetylmuramoyl-L-alanine amidase